MSFVILISWESRCISWGSRVGTSHRKFRFIIPIKGQYSNRIKEQCQRINEQLQRFKSKNNFNDAIVTLGTVTFVAVVHQSSAFTCRFSAALISETGMQRNYDRDILFYLKKDAVYIAEPSSSYRGSSFESDVPCTKYCF